MVVCFRPATGMRCDSRMLSSFVTGALTAVTCTVLLLRVVPGTYVVLPCDPTITTKPVLLDEYLDRTLDRDSGLDFPGQVFPESSFIDARGWNLPRGGVSGGEPGPGRDAGGNIYVRGGLGLKGEDRGGPPRYENEVWRGNVEANNFVGVGERGGGSVGADGVFGGGGVGRGFVDERIYGGQEALRPGGGGGGGVVQFGSGGNRREEGFPPPGGGGRVDEGGAGWEVGLYPTRGSGLLSGNEIDIGLGRVVLLDGRGRPRSGGEGSDGGALGDGDRVVHAGGSFGNVVNSVNGEAGRGAMFVGGYGEHDLLAGPKDFEGNVFAKNAGVELFEGILESNDFYNKNYNGKRLLTASNLAAAEGDSLRETRDTQTKKTVGKRRNGRAAAATFSNLKSNPTVKSITVGSAVDKDINGNIKGVDQSHGDPSHSGGKLNFHPKNISNNNSKNATRTNTLIQRRNPASKTEKMRDSKAALDPTAMKRRETNSGTNGSKRSGDSGGSGGSGNPRVAETNGEERGPRLSSDLSRMWLTKNRTSEVLRSSVVATTSSSSMMMAGGKGGSQVREAKAITPGKRLSDGGRGGGKEEEEGAGGRGSQKVPSSIKTFAPHAPGEPSAGGDDLPQGQTSGGEAGPTTMDRQGRWSSIRTKRQISNENTEPPKSEQEKEGEDRAGDKSGHEEMNDESLPTTQVRLEALRSDQYEKKGKGHRKGTAKGSAQAFDIRQGDDEERGSFESKGRTRKISLGAKEGGAKAKQETSHTNKNFDSALRDHRGVGREVPEASDVGKPLRRSPDAPILNKVETDKPTKKNSSPTLPDVEGYGTRKKVPKDGKPVPHITANHLEPDQTSRKHPHTRNDSSSFLAGLGPPSQNIPPSLSPPPPPPPPSPSFSPPPLHEEENRAFTGRATGSKKYPALASTSTSISSSASAFSSASTPTSIASLLGPVPRLTKPTASERDQRNSNSEPLKPLEPLETYSNSQEDRLRQKNPLPSPGAPSDTVPGGPTWSSSNGFDPAGGSFSKNPSESSKFLSSFNSILMKALIDAMAVDTRVR